MADNRKKIQLYRTETNGSTATNIIDGELAVNLNSTSPFVMFKDTSGTVQKLGALSTTTGSSVYHTMTQKAITDALTTRKNETDTLVTALNSEITARKAVDGQSGQTYAKNSSYVHISGATSLNDADIRLNNAITAETKARQDAINALDATVSGNGTHVDVTVTQLNGKITGVSVAESDIASASALTAEISNRATAITNAINALDATVTDSTTNVDITIVEENGKLKSVELTQTDIASAAALTAEIAARKAVDGQSGQIYTKNSGYTHISGATSLNDADIRLNNAITAETKARQDAINALDATVSGNGTHVDVTVTQLNGKVTGVSVAESDIASAAALTAEIAARKAVDGQSGQTYAKNSGYTHISGATSLNNADVLLNNAITAETKARQDAINALDATVSGNGTHVDVTVTQLNGKITGVSVAESDIASAAALTAEISNRATAITNAINALDATVSGSSANVTVKTVQSNGKLSSLTVTQSDIASASALSSLNDWCAYMSGHTTATSLTSVPTTKRLCIATISSSQTLGLNGSISDGREVHIIVRNSSSNDITITIPSSYKNMNGENLVIYGGSYAEINLVSDGSSIYYRGAS